MLLPRDPSKGILGASIKRNEIPRRAGFLIGLPLLPIPYYNEFCKDYRASHEYRFNAHQ